MANKTFLPPGFRFHPTDVELVSYYLKRKVMGKPFQFVAISDVDLYKFSPWDLPEKSCLRSKDLEWFFFCPRDKKYPRGTRANRSTETGYWKTTGQDRTITLNSRTVGMKKTLVFHSGKPPHGERTNWVMYEYRLSDDNLIASGIAQDSYVLCKIFKKSGMGPKIGEQYGAPFNEEEWEEYDGVNLEVAFLFLPAAAAASESNNNNDKTIIPESVPQSVTTQSGDACGALVPCPAVSLEEAPEMEGIELEELAHLLMDSPYRPANALCQLPPQMPIQALNNNNNYNVDNGIVDTNADGIYKELSDLVNLIPDSTDTSIGPVLSELGSDNYLELNDIFALGPMPFDWSLTQDNYGVFPQYPSQMDMGGYLSVQGQNGPISELDHVVNPSNDHASFGEGDFGSMFTSFG